MESCNACPIGRAALMSNSSSCSACIAGKYLKTTGAMSCIDCESGKYGTLEGMTNCDSCSPGENQPLTGQQACVLCDAGKYTNVIGQAICLPCESGSYSSIEGTSQCAACEPGYFSYRSLNSSVGAIECSECEKGEYADSIGQAGPTCKTCSAGAFSNHTATTRCTLCPVGRHRLDGGGDNGITCDECQLGQYSKTEGAQVCLECDAGTFANTTELSSCYACPKGTYSVKRVVNDTTGLLGGAWECIPCASGFYQGITPFISSPIFASLGSPNFWVTHHKIDAESQAYCKECLSGTYSTFVTGIYYPPSLIHCWALCFLSYNVKR
jgi:hypothetical protein